MIVLCLGSIAVAAFAIEPMNFAVHGATYLSIICLTYAAIRALACFSKPPSDPAKCLLDDDLPIITVMLPVYHESHMIRKLLAHVTRANYPSDKLDIIILCEPDDPASIRAAQLHAGDNIRVMIGNGIAPKTKPNAMNQALPIARGEIITVYDAEDRPHRQQLRTAAEALTANADLAVVQAPLSYYNANQNWLTRQFAIEYAAFFYVWVPFLVRLGLPFPLGGTSNHIRRVALEEAGAWDAYNVTEDADLSFRFAALGWESGYISCPTMEEAVSNYPSWEKQRSRWMKGYMQTWITHMKRPWLPFGRTALKRIATLQLTIGMTLICGLFHVPGILFTLWTLSAAPTLNISALYMLPAIIALAYIFGVLIGIAGVKRSGQRWLVPHCLMMPIYWLALFFPTIRALWELWRSPFHWHKTDHGDIGAASQPAAEYQAAE